MLIELSMAKIPDPTLSSISYFQSVLDDVSFASSSFSSTIYAVAGISIFMVNLIIVPTLELFLMIWMLPCMFSMISLQILRLRPSTSLAKHYLLPSKLD